MSPPTLQCHHCSGCLLPGVRKEGEEDTAPASLGHLHKISGQQEEGGRGNGGRGERRNGVKGMGRWVCGYQLGGRRVLSVGFGGRRVFGDTCGVCSGWARLEADDMFDVHDPG